MFQGWKTYICAVLLLVAAIAKGKGWIDDGAWQVILTILNGLGLAALRSGQVTESAKVVESVRISEDRECDRPK
jgi:hypothetical protein